MVHLDIIIQYRHQSSTIFEIEPPQMSFKKNLFHEGVTAALFKSHLVKLTWSAWESPFHVSFRISSRLWRHNRDCGRTWSTRTPCLMSCSGCGLKGGKSELSRVTQLDKVGLHNLTNPHTCTYNINWKLHACYQQICTKLLYKNNTTCSL